MDRQEDRLTGEIHPFADFASADSEKKRAIMSAGSRSGIGFRDDGVKVGQQRIESIFVTWTEREWGQFRNDPSWLRINPNISLNTDVSYLPEVRRIISS